MGHFGGLSVSRPVWNQILLDGPSRNTHCLRWWFTWTLPSCIVCWLHRETICGTQDSSCIHRTISQDTCCEKYDSSLTCGTSRCLWCPSYRFCIDWPETFLSSYGSLLSLDSSKTSPWTICQEFISYPLCVASFFQIFFPHDPVTVAESVAWHLLCFLRFRFHCCDRIPPCFQWLEELSFRGFCHVYRAQLICVSSLRLRRSSYPQPTHSAGSWSARMHA